MEQVRVVWFVEFIGEDWLMPDVEEFNSYEAAKSWADPAKFAKGVRPTALYATLSVTKEIYRESL